MYVPCQILQLVSTSAENGTAMAGPAGPVSEDSVTPLPPWYKGYKGQSILGLSDPSVTES